MEWLGNFRKTKSYDLLVAAPLILFYALMIWRQSIPFLRRSELVFSGRASLLETLSFLSFVGTIAFSGLLIVLLLERRAAVGRLSGIAPRLTGFLGTFMVFVVISFMSLKPVLLPVWVQGIATVSVIVGTVCMLIAVSRLGKSFSIMPEARQLVTTGPYSIVRHPLYMAEQLAVIGMVLQYQQPWALMLGVLHTAIQYQRTVYEERVLSQTFPEYQEYRKQTPWRFIPGVI